MKNTVVLLILNIIVALFSSFLMIRLNDTSSRIKDYADVKLNGLAVREEKGNVIEKGKDAVTYFKTIKDKEELLVFISLFSTIIIFILSVTNKNKSILNSINIFIACISALISIGYTIMVFNCIKYIGLL